MGYITFRVEKIKTSGGLSVAHDHNQREGFCENADESRKFMNRQLMPCAPDYTQFFEDRLPPPFMALAVRLLVLMR